MAILSGSGTTPPDQVNIGNHYNIDKFGFSPRTNASGEQGVALRWDPRLLQPGESLSVRTMYGIGRPASPGPGPTPAEGDGIVFVHHGSEATSRRSVDMADMRPEILGVEGLSLASASSSEQAMNQLSAAMETVSKERGRFGSILGALDANEKRLGDQSLQARAANQRIEEADMASVLSELASRELKMNLALSVMNQANRESESVLTLLNH